MLMRALEAGVSYSDFWAMSPRAVIMLRKVSDEARGQRLSAERVFQLGGAPAISSGQRREPERVKLNYIPR